MSSDDSIQSPGSRNKIAWACAGVVPVEPEGGVFRELNKLKRRHSKVYDHRTKDTSKFNDGFFGHLVTSRSFEVVTIAAISMNAMEIGWEVDYAARWGKPKRLWEGPVGFIVAENIFAVYFTIEIILRFLAYKTKGIVLRDWWFLFDTFLVFHIVAETWIVSAFISDQSIISAFRRVRLLRVARITKVLRAIPDLVAIIKSIGAASRATTWSAVLLVIVTYTWAILFTNQFHQGNMLDDNIEDGTAEWLFGSVGKSFFSLLVMGTILDDVTVCADAIRQSSGGLSFLCAFLVYIVMNSFTIMNLLVGVLVKMVDSASQGTRRTMHEQDLRDLVRAAFVSADRDVNGVLNRSEFLALATDKYLMKSFRTLGISVRHFYMYGDLLFGPAPETEEEHQQKSVDFESLVNVLLRYQTTEGASNLDLSALSASVRGAASSVQSRMQRVERSCEAVAHQAERIIRSRGRSRSRGHMGTCSPESPRRITVEMMSKLEAAPQDDIINELQRRFGLLSFEEVGIPFDLLDESLQEKIAVQNELLTVQQAPSSKPEWSNEIFAC